MDYQSVRRRLWAGTVAISALCAQYTTVLMALPEAAAPRAFWNDVETTELVNYLHDKRSEGDSSGNFKPFTYNAAAKHIATHLSQGPAKTGAMCRTKWTGVCPMLFFLFNY